MEYTDTTKQLLLCEIEQLPNVYLSELQNFIQYLQFKQASANSAVHHTLQPTDDPILRSCGFIDSEPFSETIDNTLYGAL